MTNTQEFFFFLLSSSQLRKKKNKNFKNPNRPFEEDDNTKTTEFFLFKFLHATSMPK